MRIGGFTGKKHSEETKRKISLSKKGRKHSPESELRRIAATKLAYENPELRKRFSVQYKKEYALGLRKGSLGKHWKKTPEQLANKMGAKNPAWKGGITPVNFKIRNSQEYAAWRKAVFERDDYRCFGCGDKSVYLEAHHIYPFALFPRLRLEVQNGITYCENCHAIMDKQKAKFVKITLN